MSQENTIPKGVTDKVAYEEYVKLDKQFDIYRTSYFQTSDKKLKIRKAIASHYIKAKIIHLPQAEQDKILAEAAEVDKLRGKLASLKRKAFGTKREKDGKLITPSTSTSLDNYKLELIDLFGRYFSIAEVHKIATSKWGLTLSKSTITNFKINYSEEILLAQERFKSDFSDVRLTHKKSRLMELSHLYINRKDIYEDSKNKEDYRLLLQTIDQIRKEVEGDKLLIEGRVKFEEERRFNLYIQSEVVKTIPIKALIVAMVAAKLNQNPIYLMSRLTHSIYAQFTGMVQTDEDLATKVISYPSQLLLNFDEITPKFLQKKREERELKSLPPALPIEQEEDLTDVKSFLIRKILAKRKEINDDLSINIEKD